MLNVNSPINRDQFRLLREAKSLIKQEFNEVVNLQDEAILVKIYNYALDSENEELFSVYEQLNSVENNATPPSANKQAKPVNTQDKTINVGDIIDGQKCVSIYRGSPVFKPV